MVAIADFTILTNTKMKGEEKAMHFSFLNVWLVNKSHVF